MNIISNRKIWYLISGIMLILGIAALIIWKLNIGIDFRGGTLLELKFPQKDIINIQEIKDGLKDTELADIQIQKAGDREVLIRTKPIEKDILDKNLAVIKSKIGDYEEIRLEAVGPTIGGDLTRKAIYAVILASIAIIVYIAFAFRQVIKPLSSWRFGIAAIIALLHDIIIVIGVFAILGHFFGFEVDSLFITALLTIMGFSVHDTIVVFDRIRENQRRNPSKNFEETVSNAILQTIARSINTSATAIIVLLALALIGGETIRPFVFTLLAGIFIGTYSSIFVASPILVSWQEWISKRQASNNA